VNLPAFLALLSHVHNVLSPTLHTPILLIAQPAWTAQDLENLTQFFFEKFKTPAFCIMDSALATAYAMGLSSATVVDVGYEKVDVTAVSDYMPSTVGRTIALPNAGGAAMTERLFELLGPKGFTREMCEQLKKSHICEVLSHGTPLPTGNETQQLPSNPAAAASTGATSSGPDVKIPDGPRGPGADTDVGEEEENGNKDGEEDGVLDIATIVTSGKTSEFLAAQEKKKAEKASARKAAKDAKDAAEAAAKPIRLPNSKRPTAKFWYEERKAAETEEATENGKKATEGEATSDAKPEATVAVDGAAPTDGVAVTEDATAPADPSVPVDDQAARREQVRAARREERRKDREGQIPGIVRREIEVGTERFQAATHVLDLIADAVHRTILSVDDVSKRGELWDSLIIVGNGSRVRGFKDALLSTLTSRYIISPSNLTMFTSELPSNLSTPTGTGANTPQREYSFTQPPTGSSVNPLLLAATTASNPGMNPSMSVASYAAQQSGHHSSHHSQSPSSIKIVKAPEYFPEWKESGMDEAVFLGAQIAAKVIFVVDGGASGGFMTRTSVCPAFIHHISKNANFLCSITKMDQVVFTRWDYVSRWAW
jgi:actin-related protein 9